MGRTDWDKRDILTGSRWLACAVAGLANQASARHNCCMTEICNIASHLGEEAIRQPDRPAIHCPERIGGKGMPRYRSMNFAELAAETDLIAAGLVASGIGRGVRAALMVRPSIELFVLMFALFKAGAVPVLIDPGINRKQLKQCLDEAAPEAFIGIPLAHAASLALGWARASIRRRVTVNGRRWFWGGLNYVGLRDLGRAQGAFTIADTRCDELAAILFTSGATGVPKGVEYTHRQFAAQVEMIRSAFGIWPGEVDMPTFPPFALFDPALGMTSVIPDMDPTRPAQADPAKLIAAIERNGVTTMFGSPALIDVLARYGEAHGIKLKTLRRVISAGAPVPPETVARLMKVLKPKAQVFTPYGATECLPVCAIDGREILAVSHLTAEGAGICVGRPLPENQVQLIRIDDNEVHEISYATRVLTGGVGEIVVRGPSMSERYHNRPEANRLGKILTHEGVWHRMGDLGRFDEEGRLWYLGRKSHRVETGNGQFLPEPVEGIFNAHPSVRRSALIGLVDAEGRRMPGVCIELRQGMKERDWQPIRNELRQIGARHMITSAIRHFFLHPGFPVDIRHNAKIDRPALAAWAARKQR